MEGRRQTVLVEHADGATRWALERSLRRQGFEVLNCPGPGDRRHRNCPLLAGGDCERLESADRVLNGVAGRAGNRLMEIQRARDPAAVTRLDPAPLHHGRPVSVDRLHLLAALDDALRRRSADIPDAGAN